MDRLGELREMFDALKSQLLSAEGSGAAAIVREMRLLSAEIESLDKDDEVSKVDELAARRADAGSSRPPARRRKSR